MVQDLKQDSLRWRAEQQGHSTRGGSPHLRDSRGTRYPDKPTAPAYLDSQTHQSRQYYGPSVTPAPVDSPYGAPAASHAQRDPYAAASVRETAGYPSQGHSLNYFTIAVVPALLACYLFDSLHLRTGLPRRLRTCSQTFVHRRYQYHLCWTR